MTVTKKRELIARRVATRLLGQDPALIVGDLIRIKQGRACELDDDEPQDGEIGIVLSFWSDNAKYPGIRLRRRSPRRHTLGGLCRQGYGWYIQLCNVSVLRRVEDK
jgi:hypothetical protein